MTDGQSCWAFSCSPASKGQRCPGRTGPLPARSSRRESSLCWCQETVNMVAGGAWRRPRMKVYDYNQEFGGNYYQVWQRVGEILAGLRAILCFSPWSSTSTRRRCTGPSCPGRTSTSLTLQRSPLISTPTCKSAELSEASLSRLGLVTSFFLKSFCFLIQNIDNWELYIGQLTL